MRSPEFVNQRVSQVKDFYARYEHYFPAAFFIGGFLFDVVTLGRIDSLFTIGQQAVYLLLLLGMLTQMLVEQTTQKNLSHRWRHYIAVRVAAMHFIFGSLLSSYTLFFFKSASLATSFGFLGAIVALLIVNELPRFHRLGLGFKFALMALCLMSYFAYVVPIIVGKTGTTVFLLSLIAGLLPLTLLFKQVQKWGVNELAARVQVLRPALFILIAFLFSYLLHIIPPVPLSIQYMGIYHNVKKNESGQFELSHERPWWRFWHSGDQYFIAQPGDKVVAFFRLFSPSGFADQVYVAWYLKDAAYGWTLQDRIPIKIVGGRDEGFRGYSVKGNYTVGDWRVVVETDDGIEIGRLPFEVEVVPAAQREFQTDLF